MLYTSSMKNLLYILLAVGVAVFTNSIAAVWAKQDSKLSIWLIAVILLSPLVFITYGLVTARLGVSVASGTVDALMTIGSIAVGLFIFREIDSLIAWQYVGIALAVVGIFLMVFAPQFFSK